MEYYSAINVMSYRYNNKDGSQKYICNGILLSYKKE